LKVPGIIFHLNNYERQRIGGENEKDKIMPKEKDFPQREGKLISKAKDTKN